MLAQYAWRKPKKPKAYCRKAISKITNPAGERPRHARAAGGVACRAMPRSARRSSETGITQALA